MHCILSFWPRNRLGSYWKYAKILPFYAHLILHRLNFTVGLALKLKLRVDGAQTFRAPRYPTVQASLPAQFNGASCEQKSSISRTQRMAREVSIEGSKVLSPDSKFILQKVVANWEYSHASSFFQLFFLPSSPSSVPRSWSGHGHKRA